MLVSSISLCECLEPMHKVFLEIQSINIKKNDYLVFHIHQTIHIYVLTILIWEREKIARFAGNDVCYRMNKFLVLFLLKRIGLKFIKHIEYTHRHTRFMLPSALLCRILTWQCVVLFLFLLRGKNSNWTTLFKAIDFLLWFLFEGEKNVRRTDLNRLKNTE